MPESIESSMFVSHRARMLGKFYSRKDWNSTKFEWRHQIFVKLSFMEFFDSELSGLNPFDNLAIIHWVKNRLKTERQAVRSWDTNAWSNLCDPHWELICHSKWHSGTSEISTPPEIAVETHLLVQHGTKTIPGFLPADRGASWLLLPSLISLLSGSTVQPENTCSCIVKVTGQVWESEKRISTH